MAKALQPDHPLSFIFLAHIEVSDLLFSKILHNELQLDQTPIGTKSDTHLSDLISSEWSYLWLFKFATSPSSSSSPSSPPLLSPTSSLPPTPAETSPLPSSPRYSSPAIKRNLTVLEFGPPVIKRNLAALEFGPRNVLRIKK
ncbi:hypothetical protein Acr_02g0003850 [Actinidia rufa]|uniref:Uncharacterized protein n=1 Tax=Actinidia rufa TaxID=165716 RepID=A0A7J0E712_9ERIC|nr:hypothetical protein Acr_02g0003850 [Actinidia rufa]